MRVFVFCVLCEVWKCEEAGVRPSPVIPRQQLSLIQLAMSLYL
jgi:hypothetical protein